jgi:hypothetical protein
MSKRDKGERAAREAARRHRAEEAAATAKRKAVNGYRHTMTPADIELTREIRFQRAQGRVAIRNTDRAVLQMRQNGCTWPQIAAALNTTKQGAMKRHAAALLRAPK